MRFLFAGGFNRRKGAHVLLDAIQGIGNFDWMLTVAGAIDQEFSGTVRSMRNPRVRFLGAVLRSQLAGLMLDHDVLVFPSLAEGSARVVFEGMAAGMATITTPNAGSVVEHGKHGWIVAPGDSGALRDDMVTAMQHRSTVASYGKNSQDLIRQQYDSSIYGQKLISFYNRLC
jgi:glycosyltransferase involved in cell wall biosynthesis